MRWRTAASGLGAAVLVCSVLLLRDQVPPPQPRVPPPTTAAQAAVRVDDPGLPVREPARVPPWRVHTVTRGAVDGVAGPAHLLFTRPTEAGLALTVHRRDTGEQLFERLVPAEDAPWASLLHNGMLVVAHGRPQVRLVAVDLTTGQVRELAPPPGYGLRPRLVELGDEVLLPGWQVESGLGCVIAVQPSTGASRAAWCSEHGRVSSWMYVGVDEVAWAAGRSATGCLQWQRLRPGRAVEAVAVHSVALCDARALLEIGGWQVTQHRERNVLQPMIRAGDGTRQLKLGSSVTFVGCGRHVYWTAATFGINPDTVYRWRPGGEYRDVAYRLDPSARLALAAPRCIDGVLSVAVTTANDGNPRLVELRSLSRP